MVVGGDLFCQSTVCAVWYATQSSHSFGMIRQGCLKRAIINHANYNKIHTLRGYCRRKPNLYSPTQVTRQQHDFAVWNKRKQPRLIPVECTRFCGAACCSGAERS